MPYLKPGGFSHHYVVDLFFDDLTEDTTLEEITEQPGQERVVVVYARVSAEDIIAGFVSILYSFCTQLATHKTEKIVQDLNVKTERKTDWIYTNQKRATTIFPLLSALSFKRENAVTF